MKRILLYILLFTGSFSAVHAQELAEQGAKKQERIQALYVAYVTKQLNLTETEAQKFWPIHSQFDAEMKAVSIDQPELDRQQQILNVKKKYQDRFVNVLGSPRANKFFGLDIEFRQKLVDQIRKRRQENNLNQRPGRRRNF